MSYPKINLKFSLDPDDLQSANAPDGYKIYRGASVDPCPAGDCSGSTPISNGSISSSDTEIIYTDTSGVNAIPYYYRAEYIRSSDGSVTSGDVVGPIIIEGESTLGHPGTLPGYGSKTPFECSVAPIFHLDANAMANMLDLSNSTLTNNAGDKYRVLGEVMQFNRSFIGTDDAFKYKHLNYLSKGIVKEYSLDKTKSIVSTSNTAYGLEAKQTKDATDSFSGRESPWFFDKGYTSVYLFSSSADGSASNTTFLMNSHPTVQHQVRVPCGLSPNSATTSVNPDLYTFKRVSDGKYIPNPILEIQEIQIQSGAKQRTADFPGLPVTSHLDDSSDSPIFPGQFANPNISRQIFAAGLSTYGRPYLADGDSNFTNNYMRIPSFKDKLPKYLSTSTLHIAVFRMQSLEEAKNQGQFPLYQIWLDGSLTYSDRIWNSVKRTNAAAVNFTDLGYTNWSGLIGGLHQSDDVYIPIGPSFYYFSPNVISSGDVVMGANLHGCSYMDALQFNESLGAKDLSQIISYLNSKAGSLAPKALGGYVGL